MLPEKNTRSRTERDIADKLKKHCDAAYTPSWNVVVGKTYGSYITHETKRWEGFLWRAWDEEEMNDVLREKSLWITDQNVIN